MTKAKQPEPAAGPTQLNLVNSGRLQALRQQSGAAMENPAHRRATSGESKEHEESARLRRQIDQRLTEILARLPAGKQHSLFKIRFGVTLDELRNLPAEQAAKILKIGPAGR